MQGRIGRVFDVFERYNVSVDMVTTSEVSISLTVDEYPSEPLIEELKKLAYIEVKKDKALVCLVGEGINSLEGIPSKLFGSLKEYKIDMISQGSSPRNIGFVVDNSIVEGVVWSIYEVFFNKG